MKERMVFMTAFESLALLYLQQQDLTEKSPSDLLVKYNEALEEIKAANIAFEKKKHTENPRTPLI